MRMRIGIVAGLSFVAVVASTGSYIGSLHAQTIKAVPSAPAPPPAPTAMPIPRKVAPNLLPPATRKIRIDAALAAAKLTSTTTDPSLDVRLTPIAPSSARAEITSAGAILFRGPAPGAPDGEYAFVTGGGPLSLPHVFMRFPTEANKLYAIDCRVQPAPNMPKIRVSIGKTSSSSNAVIETDDGHVFYALQATGTSTEVSLLVMPYPNNTTNKHGYFYGCDFGKVQ